MLGGDAPDRGPAVFAPREPEARQQRVEVQRNPLRVGRLGPLASTRRAHGGDRLGLGAAEERRCRRPSPAARQTRSPSTWMSVPPASKRTARTCFHAATARAARDGRLELVGDRVDLAASGPSTRMRSSGSVPE